MSPAAATIALGEGLDLPLGYAATQVYAFMGRRGSGKTYAAGRLVELLLEHGGQVVIIDPVGVWWGLRFLADGKTPSGLNIPVFGGWHGDMPLPPTAGKVMAELVATRSTSMVLDVSDMTGADQRRFVADFCRELLHAKKRARSPVLVVYEEAQEFVPQHVRGDQAAMVGAVEKAIKLGRNFGIGAALISQRPQAVNKDALNQAEVMLAFQLTGPQERKAITGWVQETGAGDRSIADDLPGLKPGTAMVWSPQWLRVFGQHRILKKKTYDASATPEVRSAELARKLPPIDLDEVRTALKGVEDEIAGNDVDALKAEVARLRREVAKGKAAAPAPAPAKVVEVVPPRVIRQLEAFEAKAVKVNLMLERVVEEVATIQAAGIGLRRELEDKGRGKTAVAVPGVNSRPLAIEVADPVPTPKRRGGETVTLVHETAFYGTLPGPPGKIDGVAGSDLKRGARRILATLKARHPQRLTADQLAVLCVMTKTGGTWATYIGQLVGRGLVDRSGGTFGITEAGLAEPTESIPPVREIVEEWKQYGDMRGKARDVFETLTLEHEATADELCRRFGMTKSGGTWATYRSLLVGYGIVKPAGKSLHIHPELAL